MRARTLLGVCLVLVGYGLLVRAHAHRPDPPRPRAQRLLGPAAELLADLQWIRFTRARIRGEQDRALAFAESALELAPSSTDGWDYLAMHLATFHASPEREPSLALRNAWFEAGLEVTRRGALQADDPGRLALTRALLCLNRMQVDAELDRPGLEQLLKEARAAARRAHELDVFGAGEILAYLETEMRL